MKKNRLLIIVILSFVCLTCPAISNAGTYMLGAKYWYTTWESSVLDWFEQDLVADFAVAGRTLTAKKDDGTGYLAGPLLSYQTDDKKWSFSLAPMFLSSFSQDWEGSSAGMDMDLSANYRLNKYMWVFFGYKYQDIDIDFTLSYTTTMGSITSQYKLKQNVHIPTTGAGFVYPVHDKVALGLQLGVLYSIPDIEMTDIDGSVYTIWTKPAFGFNGEFTVNCQPIDKLIVQAGYRYQFFRLDALQPQTWQKTESNDISHGPTLSAVWVF